jgi:hypothetical protein
VSNEPESPPTSNGEVKAPPEPDHITGRTFVWGRDGEGWAIWVRDRPGSPTLRFGAEDRDHSRERFQRLEREANRSVIPQFPARDRERDSPTVLRSAAPEHVPAAPTVRLLRRIGDPWMSRSATRRSGGARKLSLVAVATVALVALVVGVWDPGREIDNQTRGSAPAPADASDAPGPRSSDGEGAHVPPDPTVVELPGMRVYANRSGGYLLSYPPSWTLTERGSEADLTSPADRVVLSFGSAPDGSLKSASDWLVSQMTRPYRDVQIVTASRQRTEQGLRTLAVGGLARDAEGAPTRFLAIAIDGSGGNKTISLRFSDKGVVDQVSAIRAIISSYRVGMVAAHPVPSGRDREPRPA